MMDKNDENIMISIEQTKSLLKRPEDNNPNEGKEIEFKGFVFNDPDTTIDKNQIFIFSFGVIHCIADAGVFGMLVDMPNGVKLKNDEWITVKGKISTIYYQPFKTIFPT